MASGAKGEVRIEEPDRVQRSVGRRSAESRATIPDLELTADVDMSAAQSLQGGTTAILVRACALALRDVQRANGSYRDGHWELYSRINVGVSVISEDVYAIPTVLDADQKSLGELAAEISTLEDRARAGELTPPEVSNATFTLSDMSVFGVTSSVPVVIGPQAAAIAAGAIRELPAIRQGAIVPSPTMTLTLACDHRILYGAHAAGFLTAVRTRLEEGSL